jgi:membrane-associated phospholipid phosphatase
MLQNILEQDAHLTQKLRVAEKPGFLRRLAILLAHSGDSWFWLVVLIPLAWLGNEFWSRRAIVYILGILVTAALVFAIKLTVRRRRPEGEWGQVYRKTDPHSFPSGHAARAVLLAILAIGLGPAWLGLILAIWAPLVMLARVAMGVHFLSDVMAGALLGVGVSLAILIFIPLPLMPV